MPQKSGAKPKAEVDVEAPKVKRAPDIQWAKNPDWTYTLIAYLGDHVAFCLKLFSDSTADATREGHVKHTAKDGKVQQYAVPQSTSLLLSLVRACSTFKTLAGIAQQ